ncbi:MAG: hypothetical protein HY744_02445 [Deltaproteobacteria bacterium]|nr:hypothetical protein [Deltaproteobacteria bacterium]
MQLNPHLAPFLAGALLCGGCARIGLREPTTEDKVLGSSINEQVVDGAAGRVAQHGTQVEVVASHVCETRRVDQVETTTRRERHNETPGRDWAWSMPGLVGLGLGIGLYVDSAGVYESEDGKRTYNPVGPDVPRAIGIGFMAAGSGAVLLALVDVFRSLGSDEEIGTKSVDAGVVEKETACRNRRPYRGGQVSMRLGERIMDLAETDATGATSFDLSEAVPRSSDAAGRHETATLLVAGTDVGSVSLRPLWEAYDDADWAEVSTASCAKASSASDCDSVRAYLDRHAAGRHAVEARRLLDAADRRLDEADWRRTDRRSCAAPADSSSCDSVRRYLDAHPSGAHAREAQRLVDGADAKIEQAARNKQAGEAAAAQRSACLARAQQQCRGRCQGNQACVQRCVAGAACR